VPNLVKVVGNPLTDSNIAMVIKELEETAVAASVTGTSERRFNELAVLVETIADAMGGSRSDVRKMATKLRQLAHSMRISGIRNHQAPRAMRAAAKGVENARALLKTGAGRAPSIFQVGEFNVVNEWGYTEDEAGDAFRALSRASRDLLGVGLGQAFVDVELWGSGSPAKYDPQLDSVLIDPSKNVDAELVLREVGERIWQKEFGANDYEAWGGKDSTRFTEAFAKSVMGRRLDAETAARLQVTVGKMTAKWPEVA
jgi:hypothetical protein